MADKKARSVLSTMIILFAVLLVLLASVSYVFGFTLTGWVHDLDGNNLSGVNVSVNIYVMNAGPPSPIGVNKTYTDSSGYFSLTVTNDDNWFYKPIIQNYYQCVKGYSIPLKQHFVRQQDIEILSELFQQIDL